jgi:NAD(P)-dependent dehydrogenase (short-subunit alcohol dehydrogenase family)
MQDLGGKTLIVTGASLGIGRALALILAENRVNLVLNARHEKPLRLVAESCAARGARVLAVAGSAGDVSTAERLCREARLMGQFHGFIHAAGVLHPGPTVWELSEEQFRDVFEASVKAAFQLIRTAVPRLRDQGGGLAVFFGSGASERSVPGIGAYCAAKAAEERLALQVAEEAPEITTFIYRPGVVETRMQQAAREATGGAAKELRTIFHGFRDRGELITPEESARALVSILSNNPRRFQGGIAMAKDGMH